MGKNFRKKFWKIFEKNVGKKFWKENFGRKLRKFWKNGTKVWTHGDRNLEKMGQSSEKLRDNISETETFLKGDKNFEK